mgnify:CR=1 FL=1
MFVYTIKASSIKFFTVILVSVVVLTAIIGILPAIEGNDDVAAVAIDYDKVKSPEQVVQFLENLGYKVDSRPVEQQDVVIPEQFDSVYEEYNNVQRSQGLNLQKYKGKTATKYTYLVTNYDYQGTVLATVLVYKNKIIGGDVCSLDGEGFLHGFEKPQLETK